MDSYPSPWCSVNILVCVFFHEIEFMTIWRMYHGKNYYILGIQLKLKNSIKNMFALNPLWKCFADFRLINTLHYNINLGITHEDLMTEIEFAAASHHVTIGVVAADIFSHLLPQRFDELSWQRMCGRITVTKSTLNRTNLSRIVGVVVPLKRTRWLRLTLEICYFTF